MSRNCELAAAPRSLWDRVLEGMGVPPEQRQLSKVVLPVDDDLEPQGFLHLYQAAQCKLAQSHGHFAGLAVVCEKLRLL